MRDSDASPIFVLGNPRSGTSLVRALIGSHPAICATPECAFAVWLEGEFADWRQADCAQGRLSVFLRGLAASRKFDTWKLDLEMIRRTVIGHEPATYAALVECVYRTYLRVFKPDATRWLDKNNWYIAKVPTLHRLFPDARFILLVRDGRDVACSYRQLSREGHAGPYAPRLSTDICEIASEWAHANECAVAELAGVPRSQWLVMRYEDVCSQPEDRLRGVISWLGESTEDGMGSGVPNPLWRGVVEPEETLPWKRRLLQPVDMQGIGRFRHELASDEVSNFERIARATLTRFGYDIALNARS